MYDSANHGCGETTLDILKHCVSVFFWQLYVSQCSIILCYNNAALMVWLGLGTEITWLGLGEDHVLAHVVQLPQTWLGMSLKILSFWLEITPKCPKLQMFKLCIIQWSLNKKYLAVSRLHVETRAVNIIYLFYF